MKGYTDCIPCIFIQALNTLKASTDDKKLQENILKKIGSSLYLVSLENNPAEISQIAYDIIARDTGISDPFKLKKTESNKEALKLYTDLKNIINESSAPVRKAVHIAAAGNIIDMGIGHRYDIKNDIFRIIETSFKIDHSDIFLENLETAERLLYIGDNCGEIVFDKLLVEELLKTGTEVIFCVKSGPIINDATMEDADSIGLSEIVKVIETGSNDIGVNWKKSSSEFKDTFHSSDIILCKGQGNFETLSERDDNLYFLLKAKCPCVAKELNVEYGDIAFMHNLT